MIRFANRAYIVFSQLSLADQGDINDALQTLEQAAQITSTDLYVRKLNAPDDIHLLAVGPKWRVLFQKHGNEVVVEDVVSQASLDAFHRATVAAGMA